MGLESMKLVTSYLSLSLSIYIYIEREMYTWLPLEGIIDTSPFHSIIIVQTDVAFPFVKNKRKLGSDHFYIMGQDILYICLSFLETFQERSFSWRGTLIATCISHLYAEQRRKTLWDRTHFFSCHQNLTEIRCFNLYVSEAIIFLFICRQVQS